MCSSVILATAIPTGWAPCNVRKAHVLTTATVQEPLNYYVTPPSSGGVDPVWQFVTGEGGSTEHYVTVKIRSKKCSFLFCRQFLLNFQWLDSWTFQLKCSKLLIACICKWKQTLKTVKIVQHRYVTGRGSWNLCDTLWQREGHNSVT